MASSRLAQIALQAATRQQRRKHQAANEQQQDGIWQQVLLDELLDDDSSVNTSARTSVSDSHSDASALAQHVTCKLLCLNKASSREVMARFPGRLSMQFCATSTAQTGQFAAWLARHGSLVGQLQLRLGQWQELPAFAASVPILIADRVTAAASKRPLSNLRSLVDAMPSPAVLSALVNVRSLTRLELNCEAVKHWYAYIGDTDISPPNGWEANNPANQLASALSSLRQLRSLNLHWANIHIPFDNNPMWRGLWGLEQLTALTTTYTMPDPERIKGCYTPGYADDYEEIDLQYHLSCKRSLCTLTLLPVDGKLFGATRPPLRPITKLQALTELVAPGAVIEDALAEEQHPPALLGRSRGLLGRLHRSWDSTDGPFDHHYGSHHPVLPCSLLKLELSSVDDTGHVLRLRSLASLTLHMAAEVSVKQMLRLTALGSLTQLQLGYRVDVFRWVAHRMDGDELPYMPDNEKATRVLKQHAEQVWPVLPLRHLSINMHTRAGCGTLPDDVLPCLGQLTALTYLGCSCKLPVGFEASLLRLQGLQELQLVCEGAGSARSNGNQQWYAWGDDAPVAAAAAGAVLPRMQQLMHAVAQLLHLKCLCLTEALDVPKDLTAAAVQELVAAPALERLQLWRWVCRLVSGDQVQGIMAGRGRPCVVVVLDCNLSSCSDALGEGPPLAWSP